MRKSTGHYQLIHSRSADEAESAPIDIRYSRYVKRKLVFLAAAGLLLAAIVLLSAATGTIQISLKEVASALLRFDRTGLGRIVWEVRMPRIIAALLVGAGLSVAGTVMQSVLCNPLASPYTLGLSSAAAFGASFAIVFLGA